MYSSNLELSFVSLQTYIGHGISTPFSKELILIYILNVNVLGIINLKTKCTK